MFEILRQDPAKLKSANKKKAAADLLASNEYQNATRGIEEDGEGVAELAKDLAGNHKEYTKFMGRLHSVMIAAHRATAQIRKANEFADGKSARNKREPRHIGEKG